MNRRGQLDKAIEAIPIFIAVAVILILFTLLSAGVFGFKKLSERDAELSSVRMPILFDRVSIGEGEKSANMTVLEAFRESANYSQMREDLLSQVGKLTPKNGCAVFAWIDWNVNAMGAGDAYIDPASVPYGFIFRNSEGVIKSATINSGEDKAYLQLSEKEMLSSYRMKFSEDNSDLTFMTYTGRCENE